MAIKGALTSFVELRRGGGRLGNIRFDWNEISCIGSLYSQRATLLMATRLSGSTRASRKQGTLLFFFVFTNIIRQMICIVGEERTLVVCRISGVQNAQ